MGRVNPKPKHELGKARRDLESLLQSGRLPQEFSLRDLYRGDDRFQTSHYHQQAWQEAIRDRRVLAVAGGRHRYKVNGRADPSMRGLEHLPPERILQGDKCAPPPEATVGAPTTASGTALEATPSTPPPVTTGADNARAATCEEEQNMTRGDASPDKPDDRADGQSETRTRLSLQGRLQRLWNKTQGHPAESSDLSAMGLVAPRGVINNAVAEGWLRPIFTSTGTAYAWLKNPHTNEVLASSVTNKTASAATTAATSLEALAAQEAALAAQLEALRAKRAELERTQRERGVEVAAVAINQLDRGGLQLLTTKFTDQQLADMGLQRQAPLAAPPPPND